MTPIPPTQAPTTGRLDAVLADLAVLGDRLEALVTPLDEAGWRTPTPAPGWDVATQISHLAWTDEAALLAVGALTEPGKQAWDALVLAALSDVEHFVDNEALSGAAVPGAQLLERWRTSRAALAAALRAVPDGQKLPWFGPPMSPTSMATARYMETWAHSLDVHEALGVEPVLDDGVRHVVFLGCITRRYAFSANGLPVPEDDVCVRLTLPSGEVWTHGPDDAANTVTGSASDFARRVTQRSHRADLGLVATGPVADQWLDIAQAFAGPPGVGREPR